jgi:hypothetical protein
MTQARVHLLKSYPAPVGGLNARDGAASMPPTDATRLINWVPDSYGLRCRKGYREWAINIPGNAPVKTIMSYFGPGEAFPAGAFLTRPTTMPGTLLAATDTAIYNVTTTTDAPAVAQVLSGNLNAGWFSNITLSNSGGNFLLACSEADGYFTFDGAVWVKRVAGALAGQIDGVDPAKLVYVTQWKRRVWFVERDSTKAWYLGVDAITGAAAAFDFGPLFKRGGHLSFLANWTLDAGEGIDDFLVAVSSNGEVLVYKGTDPATDFANQGSWFIGQIPVGRRGHSQYGGDLLIVSTDGINPLSQITRGGSGLLVATNKEYSSKISILVGEALRKTFTTLGWQLFMSPSDRLLICNKPDYEINYSEQFALSTVVNEWTVLRGVPALCFGTVGGYSFVGTATGKVLLIFQDFSDDVKFGETLGEPIQGEVLTASSDFDAAAQKKMFAMIQVSFVAPFLPGVTVDVVTDYKDVGYQPEAVSVDFVRTAWNAALWGEGTWGASNRSSFNEWYTVNGLGNSGAAYVATACVGDTTMTRITYMYQVGGPF